jgi:hypothetical protein
MSIFDKLFGKAETSTPTRQWKVWCKDRALAKKYVEDKMHLTMLLAMARLSPAEMVAIENGASSGKYKIVPSNNNGDQGFDLVIFY